MYHFMKVVLGIFCNKNIINSNCDKNLSDNDLHQHTFPLFHWSQLRRLLNKMNRKVLGLSWGLRGEEKL